jgi:hypothetical protein
MQRATAEERTVAKQKAPRATTCVEIAAARTNAGVWTEGSTWTFWTTDPAWKRALHVIGGAAAAVALGIPLGWRSVVAAIRVVLRDCRAMLSADPGSGARIVVAGARTIESCPIETVPHDPAAANEVGGPLRPDVCRAVARRLWCDGGCRAGDRDSTSAEPGRIDQGEHIGRASGLVRLRTRVHLGRSAGRLAACRPDVG